MDKLAEELMKRGADLNYQVHYNKQLLMKILAHVIALDLSEDKLMGFGELTTDRSIAAFLSDLNIHIAKVHFTDDEITDITNIIEESKKFI